VSDARNPDRGLALERTTLAWHRTGLSSVAVGAVYLKVFWGGHVVGVVLAAVLVAIGAFAYGAGGEAPAARTRVRVMSLAVTSTAVLGAFLGIVG
jgi:uncharacterized membrane protein YidH (DUF202 family)